VVVAIPSHHYVAADLDAQDCRRSDSRANPPVNLSINRPQHVAFGRNFT